MPKLTVIDVQLGELGDAVPDVIAPVSIAHNVDSLVDANPDAYCSYLVYRFERDGHEVTARAYLDDIRTVIVLTPTAPVGGDERAFLDDVAAYLARRYETVGYLHDMR